MSDGPGTAALRSAEAYHDFVVHWQFRPWTAVLLAEAALRSGERVLDLATGTGIVAHEVAPLVGTHGQVVAVDVNPAMLTVAQTVQAPPGAVIQWYEGDASHLPLPDTSIDVVLCQQGLQYFPDRPTAAAEVRRVLAPGGRAVFAVWRSLEHNPVQMALNAAAQRRLGVPAMAMPFSLGDAGAVQTLFELAGFAEVAITPRMLVVVFPSRAQYVRRNIESLSAVVPELGAMDGAERTALARKIDEDAGAVLGAHAWGDGIAIPMSAHLIQGVKPDTGEF
jgi:ubiquinone/menaquinone biosynthesis C-methylase UbiE